MISTMPGVLQVSVEHLRGASSISRTVGVYQVPSVYRAPGKSPEMQIGPSMYFQVVQNLAGKSGRKASNQGTTG